MDIERGLISRVIDDGALREALDQRIVPEFFTGDGRAVWLWMNEHYLAHNQCPGRDAVTAKFPKYALVETTEGVGYWCEEMRRRHVFNETRAAMAKATKSLSEREPFDAVGHLRGAVHAAEQLAGERRDAAWSTTRSDRLARYEVRKSCAGVTGLPMPFPRMTKVMGGLQNGEFMVVAAQSGIGKTWFTVIASSVVRRTGRPVFLSSKEMMLEQLGSRLDAFEAKLNYNDFRHGNLDLATEDRYRKWLESPVEGAEVILNDDAEGGVTALAAKIELYNPSLVIVDGFYLMEDDTAAKSKNAAGWERVGNVSKALKRLAKRKNIPIIVTGQLTADNEMAYFKGIRQDADLVLLMKQTPDQYHTERMTFELDKHREGEKYNEEVIWSLSTMTFEEIEAEKVEY